MPSAIEPKGSEAKALIRIIEFAEHRQVLVKQRDGQGILIDRLEPKLSCRLPTAVLQLGLSLGLFQIGQGGSFILLDAAHNFLKRQTNEQDLEPFRTQHQDLTFVSIEIAGERRTSLRNDRALCLNQLQRIKNAMGESYFSNELLAAGERLSSDFEKAQLQPRVTSRWEAKLNDGTNHNRSAAADISDFAADARSRFNRAVAAIGPELSGVVVDAVCFEKGLEMIERERKWPARSAKLMLKTGLEILARHYQPTPAAPSKMRHWHDTMR